MNRNLALLLALAMVAITAGCDDTEGEVIPIPPPPPQGATVQGNVRDATDSSGVVGATVAIGGQSDITDTNGFYKITNVPTGSRQVAVAPPAGYVLSGVMPAQQIASGTNRLPDILLAPEAQAPPTAPMI